MSLQPHHPPTLTAQLDTEEKSSRMHNIKAELLKEVGQPIKVATSPVAMAVRDEFVWTAESGYVLRKTNLETGATVQLYHGHEGPVSALAFAGNCVITGSWDKTICVWDMNSAALLSTTKVHRDIVNTLLYIPSLKLLASGSSDKSIRFWDLYDPLWVSLPLKSIGSISSHTGSISCLAVDENSFACIRLFSADSVGTIKVWRLDRQYGGSAKCKAVLETDIKGHLAGINEMWHGGGFLWTDYTVQVHEYPIPLRPLKKVLVLHHPVAVRCILPLPATMLGQPYVLTGAGDMIRAYDLSVEDPEILSEIDVNDVTSLAYWARSVPGKRTCEVWIVSGSLDGTLRKWNLAELVSRRPQLREDRVLTRTPDKGDIEQESMDSGESNSNIGCLT